jgi:L-rhamnose mutarotase
MAIAEEVKVKRFCKVIGVKPDKRDEYLELHRNIWPEIRENIHRANIRNYSLFARGELLIQYYEYCGDDIEADFKKDNDNEFTQKWEALCRPCHEPLPDRQPEEWWCEMEEILHCD